MSDRLSEWQPSKTAIELIRLNSINDEQIQKSLKYLRNRTELDDIANVDGYDNWNAFFIMFCIKVGHQK